MLSKWNEQSSCSASITSAWLCRVQENELNWYCKFSNQLPALVLRIQGGRRKIEMTRHWSKLLCCQLQVLAFLCLSSASFCLFWLLCSLSSWACQMSAFGCTHYAQLAASLGLLLCLLHCTVGFITIYFNGLWNFLKFGRIDPMGEGQDTIPENFIQTGWEPKKLQLHVFIIKTNGNKYKWNKNNESDHRLNKNECEF